MRRLYLNDTQKILWLSGSAVMARIRSSLQEHTLLSCGGRLFTFWKVTVVPFEMKSRLHRKRGRGAAHMHNNELLKLPCSCVCMCKHVRTCVCTCASVYVVCTYPCSESVARWVKGPVDISVLLSRLLGSVLPAMICTGWTQHTHTHNTHVGTKHYAQYTCARA